MGKFFVKLIYSYIFKKLVKFHEKKFTYFLFQVWYAAVTQSFFSLSVGFGALFTYSSYNGFRHNVYRDALIISFTDTFTSLLAGM